MPSVLGFLLCNTSITPSSTASVVDSQNHNLPLSSFHKATTRLIILDSTLITTTSNIFRLQKSTTQQSAPLVSTSVSNTDFLRPHPQNLLNREQSAATMSSSSMTVSTSESLKGNGPSNSKNQPWRTLAWPVERPTQRQAQIYGFKKGETMVFDGNAGNFFARSGWKVEGESGK